MFSWLQCRPTETDTDGDGLCVFHFFYKQHTVIPFFLLINNRERKSPSTAGSNVAEMNCKHEAEDMKPLPRQKDVQSSGAV